MLKDKSINKRIMLEDSSSLNYDKIFYESRNNKLKSFPSIYDKKGIQKEYVNRYHFKTQAGNDISYALILEAEQTINRTWGRQELLKYLKEEYLAYQMEKGLFEFALIKIKIDDLQNHYVTNIYNYQLNNLCRNLDPNDPGIENKTLIKMIKEEGFDPYLVPFLPAEQMHPERWAQDIEKRNRQNDAMTNFQTTDIYTCKKCKFKKFKTIEIQLRSADESSNFICTCMNCYFTFIK